MLTAIAVSVEVGLVKEAHVGSTGKRYLKHVALGSLPQVRVNELAQLLPPSAPRNRSPEPGPCTATLRGLTDIVRGKAASVCA